MNIASTGAAQIARPQPTAAAREASEPPGPDHDGDADDAVQAAAVKAPLPQGVGKSVDKTA